MKVSVRIPRSLVESSDDPLVVDAVYFVVRVLRNATRGYLKTAVSTEPSPQAQHLADRAIKEIEAAERREITEMKDDRIREYITVLQKFLTKVALADTDSQRNTADQILKKMRTPADRALYPSDVQLSRARQSSSRKH